MADEGTYGGLNPNQPQPKIRAQKSSTHRWKAHETRALFEYLVDLAKNGSRANKYAAGATYISSLFGINIGEQKVKNHLRTWRAKWMRILLLKNLSGVGWDEDQKMIVMGVDEQMTYLQAHHTDEPYINRPIEYHDEMQIIFGEEVASGRWARGNQDPLGGVGGNAEDDDFFVVDDDEEGISIGVRPTGEQTSSGSKRTKGPSHMSISQPSKRRSSTSRMPSMQAALDLLANSFDGIGRVYVQEKELERSQRKEIYKELQKLIGQDYDYHIFTADHVSSAYDYLLEHAVIGEGFLERTPLDKLIWMSQYVTMRGI